MLGVNSLKTYKNLLPVNQNAAWYDHIERIPGVIRFDNETYGYLASVLGRFKVDDSYLACPAYHAYTGRHGLWGYSRGKAFLLFARHPNDDKKIIIYPQFGSLYPNLALELLDMVNLPGFEFIFARYPVEYADFMAASMNKSSGERQFKAEIEQILDWTYPVYTLSTAAVLEKKGQKFRSFRYDLYQVDPDEIRIEKIDPHADMDDILAVIEFWSSGRDDAEDIISGYAFLLNLMKNPIFNLSGLKLYKDERLIAFEVWSLLGTDKTVANNLAGMNVNTDENLKGFSSFQYYTVCKTLYEQGVERVCIGGSETVGLDQFKKKMNPVKADVLKSIKVSEIVNTKVNVA